MTPSPHSPNLRTHRTGPRGFARAAATVLLTTLPHLGCAPASTGQEAAAGAAETLPPPRPDASHGLQLQRLVERWLAAGSIDGRRGDPLPAAKVLGVRVTLRSDGFHQGTGTAWVRPEALRARLEAADAPGTPEADPADLRVLAQEAAVEAFRAAEASLEEDAREAREAGRLPRLQGAAAVARLGEVADQIQADVQIAFGAEPVRAPAAADAAGGPEAPGAAGPEDRFVPGFHGLLSLPEGAETPEAVWPATALAYDLPPRRQLDRVAQGLGLPMKEWGTLGRAGGPGLCRFEVVHAVRPQRGASPQVLERGNLLVPRHRLDGATLAALGDRLGRHLQTHYPEGVPVRGTWRPERGRYEPSLATREDAALGAYALAAHDRWQAERSAALGEPAPPRVSGRVRSWHEEVDREWTGGAAPPLEPAEAALLTLGRLADRGGADAVSGRAAAALLARVEEGEVRRAPAADGGPGRPVPVTVGVMSAYALGLHGLAAGDAAQLEAAAAVLDALWGRGDAAVTSAGFSLPWLGQVARDVEPALVDRGLLTGEEAERRRGVLLGVLPVLQEVQVIRRPDDGPADTLGGFLLRTPPPGGVAEPDAATAPMLQFLSLGLTGFGAGPDAAPGGPGLLITAGAAARFLAQLSFDDASLYYARFPQNAVGGLRTSLDRSRLPIGPTAAGLLAVDELQRALEELRSAG